MADMLTQLQDCLDDLLTQMYASLNYIYTRHPYGDIPGQPSQAPEPTPSSMTNGSGHASNGDTAAPSQHDNREAASPAPEPRHVFNAAMHELAQDLVLKEQQIEIIINRLPGIGNSETDYEKRLRELEAQLRQTEEERARKEVEKQAMVHMLGDMIGKVKRVP